MSKVRDEYVAAGCLKTNDKSRVYLLDSAAKIKHQLDVGHHGMNYAYYAIDRIEKLASNCLLMVHMCSLATVILLKDWKLVLVGGRAMYGVSLIYASGTHFDEKSGRLLSNFCNSTLDMRLKLTFH